MDKSVKTCKVVKVKMSNLTLKRLTLEGLTLDEKRNLKKGDKVFLHTVNYHGSDRGENKGLVEVTSCGKKLLKLNGYIIGTPGYFTFSNETGYEQNSYGWVTTLFRDETAYYEALERAELIAKAKIYADSFLNDLTYKQAINLIHFIEKES